jgi:hypothetical protein
MSEKRNRYGSCGLETDEFHEEGRSMSIREFLVRHLREERSEAQGSCTKRQAGTAQKDDRPG